MRKTYKNALMWALYGVLFLFMTVFQTVTFGRMRLFGVKLSLIPVTAACIAMHVGGESGAIFGLAAGLFWCLAGAAGGAIHIVLLALCGAVVGYAFCIHKQFVNDNNMTDIKTLYIDDLCVDERARGGHIGTRLYEYVLDFARQQGYYNVTLNVWADNVNARKFYEKIGLRVQKIGMEKIL